MVLVVNNSERAITIIDILLTPGKPTELPDEYYEHPGVQVYTKELTERNVPIIAIVTEEEPKPKSAPRHETKAEMMARLAKEKESE
jgi:hypothetical protein